MGTRLIARDRKNFSDEATFLIAQPVPVPGFVQGLYDSVTEIMRTAYGTPEWCYDHGNIVGFRALPPAHLLGWTEVFAQSLPGRSVSFSC